jgi:hypothetical protein
MRWCLYILLAVCLCLLASSIYPDFIIPYSVWEQWAWSVDGKRVTYSGASMPPALRMELPIFTVITLPPTWIAERLGYHRTMYGYLAASHAGLVGPGSSFHYTPPPLIAALEFMLVGVPFWFIIVTASGELVIRIRRRRARK